jgi:DNA-3-methyladenine glycosylase II
MTHAALAVCAPFPWRVLTDYLSVRCIPEVERVEDRRYWRRDGAALLQVSYDAEAQSLSIRSVGEDGEAPVNFAACERIARLFAVDLDTAPIMRRLVRSPTLASRVRRVPGLRPLGAWSPFELCVRTVLGQQVTVAAAATLMRRWVQRCGAVTPAAILAADLEGIGMPQRRVESIRSLARAVLEERIRFDAPWEAVNDALQSLPGFGPWTREYLAIRLGRDPDAFPATDLGLIRAANAASARELLQLAETWRPFRAYAATYLWAVSPES